MRSIYNKNIAAVIIITAAMNIACQNSNKEKDEINIMLSTDTLTNVEDLFSEIDLCYLDSNDNSNISGVALSTKMFDDIILVESSNGIIYVYNYLGKFLGSSKNVRGNGHGEFNVFTGFSYNRYSQQLEILTPKEMLFYDSNFRYTSKIEIPTEDPQKDVRGTFYRQIFDFSKTQHILLTSPIENRPNEFVLFNSNSIKEGERFSYDKYAITESSMQEQSFFELNDQEYLFFPPCLTNKIFTCNKNGKVEPYATYTGSELISSKDVEIYSKNRNKMLEFLAYKCNKIMPLRGLGNSKRICTFFKKGGSTLDTYTTIFNINNRTSKTVRNRTRTDVYLPIFSKMSGDTLFALVPPQDIKKMGKLSILNRKSKSLIESASDETNYAIAKYILSKN